jgi:PAS domain S-box-containing protein
MEINMNPDRESPESKQVAEALHEQQEWLRVTLSSIGDAVITIDTKGCVTFLNPIAQSLTGWTQKGAAGIPLEDVFKIVNEETRQTVENPATLALREDMVVGLANYTNHTLLIAKDGTERPIDDSAAQIRNASGEVAGVVLMFHDITQRRRQERGVEDALLYAENVIETLREPFIVLDKSLRIRTANRSFYETFHVSLEETENQFIYDLGNRQWNIPKLRTLLEQVLDDHHPIQDFEVEHIFPTIGRKIMLLNARHVSGKGDHSDLILLAMEDITDRRWAEASVKNSELRYRRLFETAQDAILILDASTEKILDANPFIEDLLGYSQGELVGKELWQLGLFQNVEESKAAFQELQEQGYIRYEHLPLQTKDGQEVAVEFVSNVYQVDHMQIIQCNIRDTTERNRLERQTRQQAEALAELHRRKDEFLAMLSHELRNPLSAIFNAMNILRLQDNDNPIQQKAKIVLERQVGQLAHLVDDLLEVSRVITGRIQLHQERLEMKGIVERAIESTLSLINRHKQTLSVSLSAEPLWVRADPTRLEQVFVNLLNNAAKYTEERGQIWLTAQQEGDEVVLRVRDSGVGIVPELLPCIFDLFTQADRTLDRSQGGLGIGLSLVQKIVELHGGTVEAHSAGLGQGSEFIVRLPALSPITESMAPLETAEQLALPSRVLVVDDNIDAADMLVMVLQTLGHEVQVAYSGQTALEMAVQYQPDFVLLDIGLPKMDGYEVARLLRQQPQTKDVWLIAMTGYGQDSDRQRTQEAGFDHHLVKPVERRKLQNLLATLAKLPRSAK